MRITTFKTAPLGYYNRSIQKKEKECLISNSNSLELPKYYPLLKAENYSYITFLGRKIHIMDGGNHATNMEHFVHAISNDVDTEIHEVQINFADKNAKQLKDLLKQLKSLNKRASLKGEYVAVPTLAGVPLLNLQDQYNKVMQDNKHFTPETIKANKKDILRFLKKIYENPDRYREYINYMDGNKIGIEYTYGVINEINSLKNKGAKVYIPSGHPQDGTLKWLAGQRNLKNELYHYIATGNDKDNKIQNLHNEIKNSNWYNFNLLTLSDANVVGIKGKDGTRDYIFAAYDSCVTDGARGVYNFSPVRNQKGVLTGYSYTDTITVEYPYNEFPANDEVAELAKFVGKHLNEVLATPNQIKQLNKCIKNNLDTTKCADKLYPIEKIFSKEEIELRKLNIQGKYVNRTLNLFFDLNKYQNITFPKCNCEGSEKPSVLSMWGSCFSTFNAIARDIELENSDYNPKTPQEHKNKLKELINLGLEQNYKEGVLLHPQHFNHAIYLDKIYTLKNPDWYPDYKAYQLLGETYSTQGSNDIAAGCFNISLNNLAKFIKEKEKTDLKTIKINYDKYNDSLKNSKEYDKAMAEYNSYSTLKRIFSKKPKEPYNYNDYKYDNKSLKLYGKIQDFAKIYEKLGYICLGKNEQYPAEVCYNAAKDILNFSAKAELILERRADGIQYIGDLYKDI